MAMDLGAATGMGSVSEPARVAAADEAISAELEPDSQPVEQSWNRGGLANNLVQHVTVIVLD
jgi:hypothetical protein